MHQRLKTPASTTTANTRMQSCEQLSSLAILSQTYNVSDVYPYVRPVFLCLSDVFCVASYCFNSALASKSHALCASVQVHVQTLRIRLCGSAQRLPPAALTASMTLA